MTQPTGHRERLWTKLQQVGFRKAFVHPYEKLEFLLTLVVPRRDTKPMAKELIQRFGSVAATLQAPAESIAQVPGLGLRSALFLRMLGELYQSMSESALGGRDLLSHPDSVVRYLEHELSGEESEYFMVLYLDAKNRLLRGERLFRGTVDRSAVFPREVAKQGLAYNARALIVAHNHPSGVPTPSASDRELTRHLLRALRTVDILLHDHLVVGREGSVSLRRDEPSLWDQA